VFVCACVSVAFQVVDSGNLEVLLLHRSAAPTRVFRIISLCHGNTIWEEKVVDAATGELIARLDQKFDAKFKVYYPDGREHCTISRDGCTVSYRSDRKAKKTVVVRCKRGTRLEAMMDNEEPQGPATCVTTTAGRLLGRLHSSRIEATAGSDVVFLVCMWLARLDAIRTGWTKGRVEITTSRGFWQMLSSCQQLGTGYHPMA